MVLIVNVVAVHSRCRKDIHHVWPRRARGGGRHRHVPDISLQGAQGTAQTHKHTRTCFPALVHHHTWRSPLFPSPSHQFPPLPCISTNSLFKTGISRTQTASRSPNCFRSVGMSPRSLFCCGVLFLVCWLSITPIPSAPITLPCPAFCTTTVHQNRAGHGWMT